MDLMQLYRVAKMYYLDGMNQAEIGKQENLSRSQISRLLEQSRQQGLVRVEVMLPEQIGTDKLKALLSAELHLENILIAPVDEMDFSEEVVTMAIAMTGLLSTLISWFVNAAPNKKLIGYSYKEQVLDIFPLLFMAVSMCIVVLLVGKWCQTAQMLTLSTIVVQVITGVVVYLLMSLVFKPKPFVVLLDCFIK